MAASSGCHCTISLQLLLLLSAAAVLHVADAAANISAVFAFGDSTLDSGNNNNLPTLLRADHLPYGEDFPGGKPTGRFTNGKLTTDYLVSNLGLKDTLPPYSDKELSPEDLATGVSFASAGSGLDDLTSNNANVITISRQLENFDAYVRGLSAKGKKTVDRLLADAIFMVSVGSNDMMMNYYMLPARRITHTLPLYHDFLLRKLQSLVQQLYDKGGRKFALAGLPPIGCVPFEMTTVPTPGNDSSQRTCVGQHNADAAEYNKKLETILIPTLRRKVKGSKVAYVDIYNPLMDMIQNPLKYGFIETVRGCCGTGTVEMGPLCSNPIPTCSKPSEYMFWDAVHPSQAAYKALSIQFIKDVLPQLL